MTDKVTNIKPETLSVISYLEGITERLILALEALPKQELTPNIRDLLQPGEREEIKSKFSELKKSFSTQNFKDLDNELIKNFDFLKKEIAEKKLKINEFKLSLADSIIENRSLRIKLEESNKQLEKFESKITSLEFLNKNLTKELSSIQKVSQEITLKSTHSEEKANQLEGLLYQYKISKAKKEKTIEELTKHNENLTKELEKAQKNLTKLQNDYKYLDDHAKSTKQHLETSEQRAEDLSELVDTLQKEKNHLSLQLSNLTFGMKKQIFYTDPQKRSSAQSKEILEPSILPPYLPFCFPERLPRVAIMKQQASTRIPAELRKTDKNHGGPASFVYSEVDNLSVINRKKIHKNNLQCKKITDFDCIPTTIKVHIPKPYYKFTQKTFELNQKNFSSGMESIRTELNRVLNLRQISYQPLTRIQFVDVPTFTIDGYSLSLYIAFMSNLIFNNHYHAMTNKGLLSNLKRTKVNKISKKLISRSYKNIFSEKLAFRYRLHLKFKRMKLVEKVFSHSFKNKNKLQTVLKTFENTISSIVEKYDSFTPPSVGAK